MNKSYIYILKSLKDGKTYTGSTNDLLRRFSEHNEGKVKSTVNRRPLRIIYQEEFCELSDARKRERYFKTTTGRRELRKILNSIIAG